MKDDYPLRVIRNFVNLLSREPCDGNESLSPLMNHVVVSIFSYTGIGWIFYLQLAGLKKKKQKKHNTHTHIKLEKHKKYLLF